MTQKLPRNFVGVGEVRGFTFDQVEDLNGFYIYKVSHEGTLAYEVVKKREVPVCLNFKERVYSKEDTKEVYPKSKDFGLYAWSAHTLTKAHSIIKRELEKRNSTDDTKES